MSRRINTIEFQAQDESGGVQSDSFSDRIVKLIPGDVVAAWLAVVSAIKAYSTPVPQYVLWIIFVVGALFAAAWTWQRASEPGKPRPRRQTVVSTAAFFVWAYATGGVYPQWPGSIYNPLWATLLIIAFSLASGLLTTP